MNVVGANQSATARGISQAGGKANYLIGDDPQKWVRSVPVFERVACKDVYPGIDLVYYGKNKKLEYDFVVSPKSNAKDIRLAFEGARGLNVDRQGNLQIRLDNGQLAWHRPVVYQIVKGRRVPIKGRYTLKNQRQVGFEIAEYDHNNRLVIDPALVFSTFLGGTGGYNVMEGGDHGQAIAVDGNGYVYVAGITMSTDFPTTTGAFQRALSLTSGGSATYDLFVTKFDPAGSTLIYSTYIGGSGTEGLATVYGSGATSSNHIGVDNAGNVYIAGYTTSSNYPTTANAYQPSRLADGYNYAILTKLNSNGTGLLYSTFLSCPSSANGLKVDNAGHAYICGSGGGSVGLPTTVGAFQRRTNGGYVAEFDTAISGPASLLYLTSLSGSRSSSCEAIAVDATGNIYVAGTTRSSDFPVSPNALLTTLPETPPSYQLHGFVTKLDPTLSTLVFSTLMGGSNNDYVVGIGLDASNNVYVAGTTSSADFPVTTTAFQATRPSGASGYLAKLNPAGTALLYSTYFGGTGTNYVADLAIDQWGQAYITGQTNSANMPVTAGAVQSAVVDTDSFLAKFDPSRNGAASLVYATVLGGGGEDQGFAVTTDTSGNAYVTGSAYGSSVVTGFPITAGAYQTSIITNFSTNHAFVSKIQTATTVSGTITLYDCIRAHSNSAQPINFEFRPTNGNPSFSRTVTLTVPDPVNHRDQGTFSIDNIPYGAYNLAIKGSKWLRRVVAVDTTLGSVSGVTATLLPGDVDGNNTVDQADLSVVIAAIGSKVGDAKYNPLADLNCDGFVNAYDLSDVVGQQGVAGDP